MSTCSGTILVFFGGELATNIRCAVIIPYYSVVVRLASFPVPNDSSLPLIGDPDGRDTRSRVFEVGESLADAKLCLLPNLLGVMLDVALYRS
jgi:hypothetical protein